MFGTNGTSAAALNGVTRLGDTVVQPHTVVVGTREYTAYIWGKRMPRTNEALVRQAANDLETERAKVGEPSPLFLLAQFQHDVREAMAQGSEGLDQRIRQALERYDEATSLARAPLPMWQAYLNRVMCGLVEGLSPLQADLFEQTEVNTILGDLHYPGFWKDPEAPLPNAEPSPTTTETNPTGSTSKDESPPSSESASANSEP